MRISVMQHVAFEGPGSIGPWAQTHHHSLHVTKLFAGEGVPTVDASDAVVIMGGPMSVNDEVEFPWLVEEKQLVRTALAKGKPILGICLGAQMIASALGAKVYRNPQREIGWFDVTQVAGTPANPLSHLPKTFRALHWHGETFDLPTGATHLAYTPACPHQAFMIGSALGLQFHLESTAESVAALVENCRGEIMEGPYQQNAATLLAGAANCVAMQAGMWKLLDNLFKV